MHMLQPMQFAEKKTNVKRLSKRFASNRFTSKFFFASCIIFTSLTAIGSGQAIAIEPPDGAVDVEQFLLEGKSLEQQGLWGEALSLYQSALKADPASEIVKTRRAVARIHYDLERRYSDASFIDTIRSTDAQTAMGVYSEVLLKIQSYYVDSPDWADLASYGLTSLEVALMTPEFVDENLPGVSRKQIQAEILRNRQLADQTTVNDRQDVYRFANSVSLSLSRNLGLSQQAATYEFICGAISALDPYSAFMSSNQYSETMSQIEGNFVGLGVELRTHSNDLEIVSVIPGGSADTGGLIKGDRIIAVDHARVSDVGSEKSADMLRGVEGSYVHVAVDRGEGPVELQLQRRRVEIPSVDEVSILDAQNGVGYIRLTNFQKTTARDFDNALWKLHRQGMRSLIVDVRGNPGGLLSASVEVADRFVTSGKIVTTRGRNTMENYTHRANLERTWRVPLVVLVDENSASASEIFAAAIRDHQRGKIVGARSYGKGSVQGIFPLNVSGGGVRLTTAKFFSPSGQAISENGVEADYEVVQLGKYGEHNKDAAIDSDAGIAMGIKAARRARPLVLNQAIGHSRPSQGHTIAGRQMHSPQ